MGKSEEEGRVRVPESVRSLRQSHSKGLPGDSRAHVIQRQSGDVSRAGEVRRENARSENGQEPAALRDQHGRRSRWRVWALRPPERDRPRLRVPLVAGGGGRESGAVTGRVVSSPACLETPGEAWAKDLLMVLVVGGPAPGKLDIRVDDVRFR